MLPDSVVSSLCTNETAALAAAMIVAGSFPDVVSFAARVAGAPHRPKVDAPEPPKRARGRPKRGNGHDREAKLAALIRDEPGVTIAEMSRRLKAAPNTVRACLERLEKPTQSNATGNPGASRPLARPSRQPNGPPQSARNDAASRRKSANTLRNTSPRGPGLASRPPEVPWTPEKDKKPS
jgi:hypothetical protein